MKAARSGWFGRLARSAALALLTALLGLAALRLLPAPPLEASFPSSRLIRAADGTVLRLTLASDGQYRIPIPLEQVAPTAVAAILLKEDRSFFWHPGVNPLALAQAAWATYVSGTRQGGSTLTMQLARRLHGLNTRTLAGKLVQIVLALQLEVHYSKSELLRAYCNLAPMGGNIEGLAAAARIYFGKEAGQLTLTESLALAVMPQNPARRFDFDAEQQRARQRLAAAWLVEHPEDTPTTTLADQDFTAQPSLPFLAPHLTDHLLRLGGDGPMIQATVEPRLQNAIERILRQYVTERRDRGLANGAVLLVDRRDMAVKALVGSAGYFDRAIDGQVNGALAKRSPGSTLKPFIYGLAIDQGLIHPLTVLNDAPTAFGPFQPENFDGRFAGPIPARDALIRSRNIPAVWLANRLRSPSLYDFLRSAGIARLRPESHYGLALVLGGGELTMEEVAGLYAMLANNGLHRPLRYRQSDPTVNGTPLLSPQAAFMVRDMLNAHPRPSARRGNGHQWATAWKTGTSWGFRDAWSVGLVGDYVLAVWLGNFDGHGNPALVGVKAAAPLFFRIADALELIAADEAPAPIQPPPGLIRVEVCAASGDLPNRWCPHTVPTWFIPGKSPIRVSTLHRPVVVMNDSGLAACPPYDPARTRSEVFEFWPSDTQRLFREAGLPRRLPPDSAGRDCPAATEGVVAGEPPRLLSPLTNTVYTLRLSRPEETIGLAAAIESDSERVYWFADNRYLGNSSGDAVLPWRPSASGRYELTAVDSQGRTAGRVLEVEFLP
ncbi:penicillin-binding protein 1C [Desulfobulbus sp.]|uniref:penicillin-binding protein 1C n=1 Tax=Desulfobulbus sp. TaxID=895 RepID=UPI00286F5973|nr:penicillin-binding protein 1C [Desulfobulbus sp.]